MARWLFAAMLLSCSAPAIVNASPPSAPASRPATSPTRSATPSVRTPTPDPSGLPKCAASQLQAVAAGVQAGDVFAGAVFVANRGTASCTVRGNPELTLLAADGSPLDVRGAAVTAGAPAAIVVPVSELRPDPLGLLGIGASAPLRWENYCDDTLPRTFRVTLPEDGGTIDGTFVDLAGRPAATLGTARCDDASGPSTLTVYPFQEPVR
jgi:uncharacterized protein DUF4232